MPLLIIVELLAICFSLSAFVANDRAARAAWARELRTPAGDSYRENQVGLTASWVGPPALVRAAALSCYLFGHAVVLGGITACFGLFLYGIGLSGGPGLWVAGYRFVVGRALLRRHPEAAAKARLLAKAATLLNLLILAIVAGLLHWKSEASRDRVALLTAVYATFSLIQAGALFAAARRVESESAALASPRALPALTV